MAVPDPGHAAVKRPRIAWHGEFLGEASLARVNRGLVRELVARANVHVVPCGEPMPQVELTLGLEPRRREDIPLDDAPSIVLRHRWPPRFMNPAAGYYVHVQPWEFGALPQAWVDALRARADAVWCYSTYVRDVYVASGIDPQRVHVIGLGFDPQIYHPDVEPLPVDDPAVCIFLYVGGMPQRKNVEALVNAYLRAFTRDDAVALVLKDNPGIVAYEHGWPAKLRELEARTDIPRIRYVSAEYDDATMARLYRSAAALVLPYRGEGFGLPVLEAMACGTPAIVSAGGATDDVVDAEVGYPVPARRASLGRTVDGAALAADGWWLDIDVDALAAAMRDVYVDRAQARNRGRAAAARVRAAWTWAHAAQRVEGCVERLAAAPPAPPGGESDTLIRYAFDLRSAHGEDGMLDELFGRLRVVDPCFVELGTTRGACSGALLAERCGWDGLSRTGNEGTALAPIVRAGLDLLSVGGAAAGLWDAVADVRPRVLVATPMDAEELAAHGSAARRSGYTVLARTEKGPGCAVFLRGDLLQCSGFGPLEPSPQAADT